MTKKAVTRAKPKPQSNGSETLHEIQKIYDFMQKNRLETLEYQQEDTHIKLVRRNPAHVPVPIVMNGNGASAPAATGNHAPAAPVVQGETVKTPMMGIFYRGSSPSSPPFIREGDAVKKGQVLSLIEAMKVFNEIKADCDCVVVKVLVENGKPVKAGQDLFVIERK